MALAWVILGPVLSAFASERPLASRREPAVPSEGASRAVELDATEPPVAELLPPRFELPEAGQSVGTPGAGSLFGGARLLANDDLRVRNRRASWGTTETVQHVLAVAKTMRARFPGLHPLLVGDLSTEVGGPLPGHFSHQSGRDVDLSPYYRKREPGFPWRFAPGTRENLHFAANFALIEALAATQGQPGGVEWILLDYGLQQMLVEWARREGVSEARLEALFQYPRGPRAPVGVVRHMPGHRNHFHVRFACPARDPHCSSPPYPPTRASRAAQRHRWVARAI